jgi:thiol:disulfide interchange protein
MKQFIYSVLALAICVNFGFGQTFTKQAPLTETQKLELKREKFDPARDANQDLQTAIAKAEKENKRIVLDIGGEWCGWCRKMDFYLMKNPKLDKLRDENFVWIKINMSEENENKEFLAKYPEIPGYPHLFVLEKDGSLLHSQSTAEIEEPDLPLIVPDDVKNKEQYIKNEMEKRKNRSYDLLKFTAFLKKWAPGKNAESGVRSKE